MLQYPSISSLGNSKIARGTNCYAFLKYDGSNIRFEWCKKRGFYKFGTRHQLLDASQPILGHAIELIQDIYGPAFLQDLINFDKRLISNAGAFTGFAEFFGENSFAGTHAEEPHIMKLIDVSVHKKGFLAPSDFSDIATGNSLYAHFIGVIPFNEELIQQVYDGSLLTNLDFNQNTKEGLILKAHLKKTNLQVKLKSKDWLDAIKCKFDNWEALV